MQNGVNDGMNDAKLLQQEFLLLLWTWVAFQLRNAVTQFKVALGAREPDPFVFLTRKSSRIEL